MKKLAILGLLFMSVNSFAEDTAVAEVDETAAMVATLEGLGYECVLVEETTDNE